jgi:hypothetical protein
VPTLLQTAAPEKCGRNVILRVPTWYLPRQNHVPQFVACDFQREQQRPLALSAAVFPLVLSLIFAALFGRHAVTSQAAKWSKITPSNDAGSGVAPS